MDAFEGSPLENASVMELDVAGWYDGSNARHNSDNGGYHQTGFDAETGTLYLYFLTVNKIETGKPYIIRWTKPNDYVAYDGSNASTCSDIVVYGA